MDSKNRRTLVIFIILIVLIISLGIFNLVKGLNKQEVDRKVDKIFGMYSFDEILNKGEELFLNGINILKDNKAFLYEKDNMNKTLIYSINGYNKYKKISNFSLVTNTISAEELDNFMNYKKIIYYENGYYMESYNNKYDGNFIGSILEIDSYNDETTTFKVESYYDENSEFVGIFEERKDNYQTITSMFTINNESGLIRVDNYQELINILDAK